MRPMPPTFLTVNFGCRVNAAELNQLAQSYIDQGYQPFNPEQAEGPDVIIINTCSVTKKADIESLSRIRTLRTKYPQANLVATGCARLDKIKNLPQLILISNQVKNKLTAAYTPQVEDKFSHTHRYILKIQSGCTQMCTYCIVPYRRNSLWSLPIKEAVTIVKKALDNGYQELIITGVNLEQYTPGLNNLLEILLKKTHIPLISFGSVPLNCIDNKLISLLIEYRSRLTNHLHIPLQSGADNILKLMRRQYTQKQILKTFNNLQKAPLSLTFGTDIIVGFPGETEADFQQTINICQKIGFSKIHTFRYSPRPQTYARVLWEKSPHLDPQVLRHRSRAVRQCLISSVTLPHTLPPRS